MAKKRKQTTKESQRQTRKDILVARKQAEQTKQIRLAVGGVIALLVLVFLVAIINEFFIAPTRAVAVVQGDKITLRDWQKRVQYERARRIITLEEQLVIFGGDVGIIQQFAGQMLNELVDVETFAQDTLDQMVNETAIRLAAEARNITVTEADIDEEIGASFNYFDGKLPTLAATATETVVPTPSLTPIPTAVITEAIPTSTPFPTPTLGPTSTPAPTATPVSAAAFQAELDTFLEQLREYGIDEETFRAAVRARLYQERLLEALAEERELPTEVEHASIFLLTFDTEEDANETAELIRDGDFITVWNTIRSAPADSEIAGTATEMLWRTQADLATTLGDEAAGIAFTLPPNVPSSLIAQEIDAENTRYYLLQVSGREVRPLADSALRQNKVQLLLSFIDDQLTGNLESTEFWRSRVPTQPVLDPKFLAPPTPTPLGGGAPAPDQSLPGQ